VSDGIVHSAKTPNGYNPAITENDESAKKTGVDETIQRTGKKKKKNAFTQNKNHRHELNTPKRTSPRRRRIESTNLYNQRQCTKNPYIEQQKKIGCSRHLQVGSNVKRRPQQKKQKTRASQMLQRSNFFPDLEKSGHRSIDPKRGHSQVSTLKF
jgi:hypothetical protein